MASATASASHETVNVLPSVEEVPGVAPAFEASSGGPKNEWKLECGTSWIGSEAHAVSVSVPGWAFATAAILVNATVPKFARGSTWQCVSHSDGASAIHSADETSGFATVMRLVKLTSRVRSFTLHENVRPVDEHGGGDRVAGVNLQI